MSSHLHSRAHGLQVESSESPAKPEDYVVVNGFRLVKPYHFDFCCSVRQRWFGQNIIDIFSREFPARDRQYYLQALADGRLRVESCQVTAETPLKDGQRMRHFIHRHEPPVPAGAIQVVGESADAVAVCKPHGMPVHVAGQYRKNTVLGILTAERPDLGPLFPIHRLDKPVSGLLLFARNPEAAAALCRKIEGREVEKVYVARVMGCFPASEEPIVADVPLAWDPVTNNATAEPHAALEAAAAPAAAAAVAAAEPAATETEPAAADAEAAARQAGGSDQQLPGQEQQLAGGGGGSGGGSSLSLDRRQRKQQQKEQRRLAKAAKAERQAAAAAAAAAAARKPSKSAAKPALTEFRLLAVAADGLTSVVECRPRTGRTHQIRVHLQYLGHPIANDAQYGGTYGGPMASREMAQRLGMHWAAGRDAGSEAAPPAGESAAAETSKRQRLEPGSGAEAAPAAASLAVPPLSCGAGAGGQPAAMGAQVLAASGAPAAAVAAGPAAAADDAYEQHRALRSQPEYHVPAELRDALCIHCPFFAPKDYPFDLRPLWLHARSYSCTEDGWSFDTELPEWAGEGWQPPPAL